MKQKTVITVNDLKVISAILGLLLLAGCIENIADAFANMMVRFLPE